MCRQFDSSQHHRDPLIISGFSFSVPLSLSTLIASWFLSITYVPLAAIVGLYFTKFVY